MRFSTLILYWWKEPDLGIRFHPHFAHTVSTLPTNWTTEPEQGVHFLLRKVSEPYSHRPLPAQTTCWQSFCGLPSRILPCRGTSAPTGSDLVLISDPSPFTQTHQAHTFLRAAVPLFLYPRCRLPRSLHTCFLLNLLCLGLIVTYSVSFLDLPR